jgi:amino acid adenylation domain-containing protein
VIAARNNHKQPAETLGAGNIIDPIDEELAQMESRSPADAVTAANIIYVIYTSGSTGRPKGVLIRHGSFANFVHCHRQVFAENTSSRISQVASPSFDAMAFEVWPCLINGAVLVIADEEVRMDLVKMKEWLLINQITISFQSTVMAELLLKEEWLESGTALRVLRTAGDRLTVYPLRSYPFRFYNLYGPTEDTVWTTWTEVEIKKKKTGEKYPPIGKPIINHRIYILDKNLRLQPMAVPGELCIGGEGLAVGYLNRPELTMEKFVPHSFENGKRIYRTGDLVRWLPNGDIEFLGRIDHQIKLRGFRIELAEIETLLVKHEKVKEAAVVAASDKNGNRRLYACVVPSNSGQGKNTPSITGLREYLSNQLPYYMIPSYFRKIEKVPITPAGKIDRPALIAASLQLESAVEYINPETDAEKIIARTWREVLELDKVGVNDNFFERGGNSLSIIRINSRLKEEFKKDIPATAIFRYPTIEALAQYLGREADSGTTAVTMEERRETLERGKADRMRRFRRLKGGNNEG